MASVKHAGAKHARSSLDDDESQPGTSSASARATDNDGVAWPMPSDNENKDDDEGKQKDMNAAVSSTAHKRQHMNEQQSAMGRLVWRHGCTRVLERFRTNSNTGREQETWLALGFALHGPIWSILQAHLKQARTSQYGVEPIYLALPPVVRDCYDILSHRSWIKQLRCNINMPSNNPDTALTQARLEFHLHDEDRPLYVTSYYTQHARSVPFDLVTMFDLACGMPTDEEQIPMHHNIIYPYHETQHIVPFVVFCIPIEKEQVLALNPPLPSVSGVRIFELMCNNCETADKQGYAVKCFCKDVGSIEWLSRKATLAMPILQSTTAPIATTVALPAAAAAAAAKTTTTDPQASQEGHQHEQQTCAVTTYSMRNYPPSLVRLLFIWMEHVDHDGFRNNIRALWEHIDNHLELQPTNDKEGTLTWLNCPTIALAQLIQHIWLLPSHGHPWYRCLPERMWPMYAPLMDRFLLHTACWIKEQLRNDVWGFRSTRFFTRFLDRLPHGLSQQLHVFLSVHAVIKRQVDRRKDEIYAQVWPSQSLAPEPKPKPIATAPQARSTTSTAAVTAAARPVRDNVQPTR